MIHCTTEFTKGQKISEKNICCPGFFQKIDRWCNFQYIKLPQCSFFVKNPGRHNLLLSLLTFTIFYDTDVMIPSFYNTRTFMCCDLWMKDSPNEMIFVGLILGNMVAEATCFSVHKCETQSLK